MIDNPTPAVPVEDNLPVSDGRPLAELLDGLPDELHTWTRDVWDGLAMNIEMACNDVDHTYSTIVDDLPDGWTRKDFALAAQAVDVEDHRYRPMLFTRLDGKDVAAAALKHLKPRGDTRALTITEDVA